MNIYSLDERYINYLQKFDGRVCISKLNQAFGRKYVGAVLGKHAVQPSAQKVSALHNKRLQAKFGTHESNVANYAEKLGLGRKTTTFVNGKEQTVFNLDPELKGAADIYNKMMQDSKTFSTKSRARASLMDKMGMTTLSGETHQSKIDKQLGKYASEVEKLKSKGK